MPHLTMQLLGSFRAALDGRPIAGFESNKVRALLAYLAVEADRPLVLATKSMLDMIFSLAYNLPIDGDREE